METPPCRSFLDNFHSFLLRHLPVVVDYAEKYGINIPLNEEPDLSDILTKEPSRVDDLSTPMTCAVSESDAGKTSELKDIKQEETDEADKSTNLADELRLEELIAQSLSKHDGLTRTDGPPDGLPGATESIEDGSFDATGLASFIAENLGPAIGNGPGVTEQQASAPLGQIPHGPNLCAYRCCLVINLDVRLT